MNQATRIEGWPPGHGEMVGRLRAHDWAGTPLGPAEAWPERLQGAVEQMLASPLVSTLAVGPERVLLYNDAAARLYGDRHPEALGRSLPETWPEAYAVAMPLYERAFAGEAVQVPAQPLDVSRAGGEVWDVILTPVRDASGGVLAVHMTGFEVGARLRAEAALRESEARYRALFTSMDEAYAVVEVLRDEAGRWSDLLFLEVNPAFTGHTGMPYPVGRTATELLGTPNPRWAETYGQVVETGESVHVEEAELTLGRVFDLNVFRLGGPGSRRVAVLFSDVTARKHAEASLRESGERQAFLLRLSDALRAEPSAEAITNRALKMLFEQMRLDRCYVGIYRLAEDTGDFPHQVHDDRLPPLPAQVRLSDFPEALQVAFDRTLVIDDVVEMEGLSDDDRASFSGLGLRALIAATLRKGENNPLWAVVAVSTRPRAWTQGEVSLVEEVAERTWGAVERARAEARRADSEERLHASEALFRQFAAASPDVIWIRNAGSFRFDYVSPAFDAVYGDAFERVFANNDLRRWAKLILPEDRGGALDAFRRVRNGERVTHEFRIRHPSDGALRWIRDTDFPILDEEGRVERVAGIGQDVTELKRAEAAVAASEARLRVLTEGIPQLVWRAVDHGEWSWASPQWTTFTGQAEAASHGWGWMDTLHPDDRPGARAAWERSKTTEEFEAEYRVREAATDAFRWFQSRATPVRDEAGALVEWLGTTTDVQVLKEFQARQEVMVAELQHRTRNLITVVQSIARQTMASTGPTEAFRDAFDSRLAALSRVQGLLSRAEQEPITLRALLKLEFEALGATEGERAALEGPTVRLRPTIVQTLALALHELGTNARKYGALSEGGGRLGVRWHLHNGDGERRVHIEWREEDLSRAAEVAQPSPGRQGGYGRRLIERALPYALQAKTTYELGPTELRCTIDLPLDRPDSPPNSTGST